MKRDALHESIRRGIALHMCKRMGLTGPALVARTGLGMLAPAVRGMADEIIATIEAEHPGAIEP